jgi:hypothetical protein
VRDGLLLMGSTLRDSKRMFGDVGDVDPVRHMIGTAGGFGGNPESDAVYLNVFPKKNDGRTPYVLKVTDVPVEGFWRLPKGHGELPSDHGGLELHRETIPTPQGNPRCNLEIPGGPAGELMGQEGPLVAHLRHANCTERCPLQG